MGTHHFHYKHPLFGRGDWLNEPNKIKPTKKGVRWDKSPYYVWFACLLRSEAYKRYCSIKRGAYKPTFAHFGNVFEYKDNFKKWFNEGNRGVRLFAEPYSEIPTKRLSKGDRPEWSNPNLCVVQFDASRYRTFVLKQVRRLALQACEIAQTTRVLSRATIQFHAPPKNCDAYLRMLRVWDMKQAGVKTAEIHRICYPNTKRDIELKQKEAQARIRSKGGDEELDAATAKHLLQKQRWQEIDRDYKRACKLIENAAKGIFPKTT